MAHDERTTTYDGLIPIIRDALKNTSAARKSLKKDKILERGERLLADFLERLRSGSSSLDKDKDIEY